jgi:hypothetical protein
VSSSPWQPCSNIDSPANSQSTTNHRRKAFGPYIAFGTARVPPFANPVRIHIVAPISFARVLQPPGQYNVGNPKSRH